ncbi:hypothetical protein [Arthrobacter sp. 2MCAF14]|uniref:hypothetical protein n=1 Tax=Arthrobacter sp. 2MCAF14 TaxID=3232982 RepID=UPI003F8F0EF0
MTFLTADKEHYGTVGYDVNGPARDCTDFWIRCQSQSASTTSAFFAFATLETIKEAMNAATPGIRSDDTEWLSEEKLQILYTLR